MNDLNNVTPLLKEYYTISQYYTVRFGKVVVLIQSGTFLNAYEYRPSDEQDTIITGNINGNVAVQLTIKDNTDSNLPENATLTMGKNIGNAVKPAIDMKITLSSKDSSKPHSINNPYQCGFPITGYKNYKDLLLLSGYTIIRIDQVSKGKKDKDVVRHITEITSPGTEVDVPITESAICSNSIVSIYLNYVSGVKNITRTMIVAGLSHINILSGDNSVCEVYSKEGDETYVLQELYRFLISKRPSEIIFYMIDFPIKRLDEYKTYFIQQLELDKFTSYNILTEIESQLADVNFQEQYLTTVFPINKTSTVQPGSFGPNNTIERLGMSMLHYGRCAYLALLNHCYIHNETIIARLTAPVTGWSDHKEKLILHNNAVNQLNLFPNELSLSGLIGKGDHFDSLIAVLDNCQTKMGSRFLINRLLSPLTNPDLLNNYYNLTQLLINDDELITTIYKLLKNFPDIEVLQRKILLGNIKPIELTHLINAYHTITKLHEIAYQHESFKFIMIPSDKLSTFEVTLKQLTTAFNLQLLKNAKYILPTKYQTGKIQCDVAFLNKGYYTNVDPIVEKLNELWTILNAYCEKFTITAGMTISPTIERKIKKDEDDSNAPPVKIIITTTTAKSNKLKSIPGLKFTTIKTNTVAITSNEIAQIIAQLEHYHQALENNLLIIYQSIITHLQTLDFYNNITRFINNLDFIVNNARLAMRYKYFKPMIVANNSENDSYLDVKELRHPLVERILNNKYITNDIQVGHPQPGLLLFGTNSTGKTSLTKAVGLAIIMAQSGMFVAGHLTYYPYNNIITRLSGNDDILKGQSSFIVEMTELKIILKNADNNTLVLGDELSRGTESGSGTGLTIATIEELDSRNSSYIFSTHMHHLTQISEIKELQNNQKLNIKHLSAHHDLEIDMLVYERKMQDGSGSSDYGIQVAQSVGIDRSFIERANRHKQKYLGKTSIADCRPSHFNSKLYVRSCVLCQKKFELETHHIAEQKKADQAGFIDCYHKNDAYNLAVLCRTCHNVLHSANNEAKIKIMQTLHGSIVKIE